MFSDNVYIERRNALKKSTGNGILLFLGNDDCGMNYEDNTYDFRQDSTFLYYFGLSFAGLSAIINLDEDEEIIFGDEISIDHIVWMGTQPSLKEKSERVGIRKTLPANQLAVYLQKAVDRGQKIHFLPAYRTEHKLKLMQWLNLQPAQQNASVSFIQAVVNQRISLVSR